VFPGTEHGFAFSERADYNTLAAEETWDKMFALWGRTLKWRAASRPASGCALGHPLPARGERASRDRTIAVDTGDNAGCIVTGLVVLHAVAVDPVAVVVVAGNVMPAMTAMMHDRPRHRWRWRHRRDIGRRRAGRRRGRRRGNAGRQAEDRHGEGDWPKKRGHGFGSFHGS
jgi:hypothetical protein